MILLSDFGIDIENALDQKWIHIEEIESNELVEKFLSRLDRGESEAIALFIELKADLLLIDEKEVEKWPASKTYILLEFLVR